MQLKNMKVRYMDVASRHLKFSRSVFRQINQKTLSFFFVQGVLTDNGADVHPKWSQVSVDEANSQTKDPPQRLCLLSETGRERNAGRPITSVLIARLKLALSRHERERERERERRERENGHSWHCCAKSSWAATVHCVLLF